MKPELAWGQAGVVLALSVMVLSGCAHRPDPASAPPQIYDPRADGEVQLASALTQAKRDGKRVLLNLGANWCGDSQAMFRLLRNDPDIRRELERHYVLVLVDVNKRGDAPRNAAVVSRFGDPLGRGIPVLLVLAADGTLLNTDPSERLADSDHQHPSKVVAYLRKWSSAKP